MSRLHPVFNIVKLTPAPVNPIEGRYPRPPLLSEIIDGEEEWVVEQVLDSKMMNQNLCYLVKWEGFRIEHNSWEPWDNIHTLELVTVMRSHNPYPQKSTFYQLFLPNGTWSITIPMTSAPTQCLPYISLKTPLHIHHPPQLQHEGFGLRPLLFCVMNSFLLLQHA